MKRLQEFLPHLTICLLLCLGVFTVLDGYNPLMCWLTSGASKLFIALCCVCGAGTSVLLIRRQRGGK